MKSIQVRNIPSEVHRALTARAATEGVSLAALIRRELPRIANRPSNEEIFARVQSRGPVLDGPSTAELIRRHRDAG